MKANDLLEVLEELKQQLLPLHKRLNNLTLLVNKPELLQYDKSAMDGTYIVPEHALPALKDLLTKLKQETEQQIQDVANKALEQIHHGIRQEEYKSKAVSRGH
jgi:hypothetical protein